MMRIFVPKETTPGERRVPLVPETAKRLAGLGAAVAVESGGGAINRVDAEYESAIIARAAS